MLLRVYAQSPADFAAWVAQQKQPARADFPADPAAAEGQAVFMHNACISCHTIAGTVGDRPFRSRPYAPGQPRHDCLRIGREYPGQPEKWIDNPNSLKPGCLMPSMHLNGRDLDAITAYLTNFANQLTEKGVT